jgi:hypothetical protein
MRKKSMVHYFEYKHHYEWRSDSNVLPHSILDQRKIRAENFLPTDHQSVDKGTVNDEKKPMDHQDVEINDEIRVKGSLKKSQEKKNRTLKKMAQSHSGLKKLEIEAAYKKQLSLLQGPEGSHLKNRPSIDEEDFINLNLYHDEDLNINTRGKAQPYKTLENDSKVEQNKSQDDSTIDLIIDDIINFNQSSPHTSQQFYQNINALKTSNASPFSLAHNSPSLPSPSLSSMYHQTSLVLNSQSFHRAFFRFFIAILQSTSTPVWYYFNPVDCISLISNTLPPSQNLHLTSILNHPLGKPSRQLNSFGVRNSAVNGIGDIGASSHGRVG